MSPPARNPLPNEDSLFLDYARRLNKFRNGRRAVRLHISRLRPHHRRDQHLRIAASTFDLLVSKFEGALFRLFNNDLVVICNGANVADIDDCVLRVRYLFSDDPLFQRDEQRGEDDADPFCDWYDLQEDYAKFLVEAERNFEERARYDALKDAQSNGDGGQEDRDRPPLDAAGLLDLTNSIRNADLSNLMRRQPICAVVGRERPHVLFNEIYFSVVDLGRLLLPNCDLLANRRLFRELCCHMDRRMIALLARRNDPALNRAFSVNLCLETLLSPAFLEFDAALNGALRRTIVVELQIVDVMADTGGFVFAREFLRDRGYRLCLDGVTYLSLPMIDHEAFGVDLVKLLWNGEMPDRIGERDAARFKDAIGGFTPDRVILCRCDSEQALEFGRSVGITLFQGYHIDHLLKDHSTLQDTVHALADARARQRAAERSLERAS